MPAPPLVRLALKPVDLLSLARGEPALRGSALKDALSAEDLPALLARAALRRLSARTPVYQQGDPTSSLFWIVSGSARLSAVVEGHVVEYDCARPGDFFGEPPSLADELPARPGSAVAADELRVIELRLLDVREVAARTPVLSALLTAVGRRRLLAIEELVGFMKLW